MEYKLLDGTKSIKIVSVSDFTAALIENDMRSYNRHEPQIYDNYISLSAPDPTFGYGSHCTLVLTKAECEAQMDPCNSMKEYCAELLSAWYIPAFEIAVRNAARTELIDTIIDKLEELK